MQIRLKYENKIRIHAFSSKRKRMSVVVPAETPGQFIVYVKGAGQCIYRKVLSLNELTRPFAKMLT